MATQETLRHFQENYVDPKRVESLEDLNAYIDRHLDNILEDFARFFKQFCTKIYSMQQDNLKGEIGYIQFSVLRTSIMENRYELRVDAYDNKWYLDKKECVGNYDVSWAFQFLDDWASHLETKRKLYINAISPSYIEKIKLQEVFYYNFYIIEMIRVGLKTGTQIKAYQEMKKEDVLLIRVGEYYDFSTIVHKEDYRIKDSNRVKEWLEEKHEDSYINEVLKDLDLQAGEFEGINLSYATCTCSNFSKSNLSNCTLLWTNFEKALCTETNFREAKMYGTSFDFSTIEEACFENAKLVNVSFRNAIVNNVSFQNAIMDDVDFTGAQIENVIFPEGYEESLGNLI